MRDALAALRPREHALWGWVLVPLVGAVALAPSATTVAGALAVVLGFLGHNGLGRALRRPSSTLQGLTGALLVAGALAGGLAAHRSAAPLVGVAVLAVAGVAVVVAATRFRGVYPKHAALELGGVAALAGLAGLMAVGGGAAATGAAAVAVALATWFAVGWWWVKGLLAEVLPGRDVPRWGVLVPVVGLPGALAACVALGSPGVGVVPWLYAARAALHDPPAGPRDARRVGLTELAWSVVAVAGMVALV